jgi:hypothetical protein
MHNPRNHRLLFIGIVGLITVIFAICIGIHQYHTYRYRQETSGKLTFQVYEPKKLPDGIQITNKYVVVRYRPANVPKYETYLQFELNGASINFQEEERSKDFSYDCSTSNTADISCLIRTSPGGQQYEVDTGKSPGAATMDIGITILKSDTKIGIHFLSVPADKPYSQQTIDEMVDSFEPAHYENLEVRHFDSTP